MLETASRGICFLSAASRPSVYAMLRYTGSNGSEFMSAKIPKKRKPQRPLADDFKSVARRLGCDEDKERFEAKLGKIVKAKKGNGDGKSRP